MFEGMFPVNNSHFLLRRLVPSGSVRILMYHGFTEERECRGIRNYGGKHLQIEKFEEQMRYLDRHCRVIPLEEGIDAFRGHQKIAPQSVILTMDDGYGSNYTLAYPVLKRYGMPATIFLSTDFVEQKDFLWVDRVEYAIGRTTQNQLLIECGDRVRRLDLKTVEERKTAASLIKAELKKMALPEREGAVIHIEDELGHRLSFRGPMDPMYRPLEVAEIRKMSEEGLIAFGNHTCSHISLTACSPNEMVREVRESGAKVEEWTRKPCDVFSYPYGEKSCINERSKAVLAELGLRCGLTAIPGANGLAADLYELKRLNIHNQGTLRGFVRTLSPFGRFLRVIKRDVMRPFRIAGG